MQIEILVPFSKIFEEEPKDLKMYLNGISRLKLLKIGAYLLGYKNHESKYNDFKVFLGEFFCIENKEIANIIYNKLYEFQKKTNTQLIIVNPIAVIQIFEFCFNNLTENESQTDIESEISIFKSILYQNEQDIKKQNIVSFSTNKVGDNLKLAAMSLSQSFPYSELINYDLNDILKVQIIKSIYFFEFLDSSPKTRIHLIEFLKYFECNDWKMFLKKLFPICLSTTESSSDNPIDIVISKDEYFESNCIFFEKLSLNDIEILNEYDFKQIKSKPFYKISEGVYRIIFKLFVVELIHKGVYFKIVEINNGLNVEEKVKNFRSFYCDEFSEKYLLYKLLNSIYKNRYIEYSGGKIKQMGIEAEPDYYIRNGNNVFLFESKDILINAEIKSSYDFDQYEIEFKKKLYFEKKSDKTEKKAVLQLINSIENVLKLKNTFDQNYKIKSINIYPILILNDHQFNLAGLNVIINSWFQTELVSLKEKGLPVDKIRPLVIIDIDTFILYQDLFRDNILKLNEIIDEFIKFTTLNKKMKYLNEEHRIEHARRTVQTFPLFISNYVDKNCNKRRPKMLEEKILCVF